MAVKKGDDNKIIGFSAIARDITQIKKLETEKKVRQEKIEEKYKLIYLSKIAYLFDKK